MSGGSFHVHGPHDHELEHAAQHEPKGMAGQLAVITAVLATVGAMFAYMGGATQADAILYKNEASVKHTQASDQWNFYQAKSNKQTLAEFAAQVVPEANRAAQLEKAKRYETEKAEISAKAKAYEQEAEEWNTRSEEQMHQHHRWAQATTALQIAIAMAAIALLTRKRWLEYGVLGVSTVGMVLGAMAWFHL